MSKGTTKADIMDAALSSSHLADRISNFDMPHILTHTDRGLKAKDPALMQRQLRHIKRHAEHSVDSAASLSERILQVPGVRQHSDALNKVRVQSDKGLADYIKRNVK